MKIAVFGSRDLSEENIKKIETAVDVLTRQLDLQNKPRTFLHGGARGAQEVFINLIKDQTNCDTVLFKPWTQIDKKLKFLPKIFFFRNLQILENADLVLILTTGQLDSEVDKVTEWCENGDVEVVKVEI